MGYTPVPQWPPFGCLQSTILFLCLLLFYILATSRFISGWVPTFGNAHSWWLYTAAPLGNQAISTISWYPTPSHYPNTEPTSPCHILIMPSSWLGSDKYQFDKSLVWLDHGSNPWSQHKIRALPVRPPPLPSNNTIKTQNKKMCATPGWLVCWSFTSW